MSLTEKKILRENKKKMYEIFPVPPIVPTNLDTIRNAREGEELRLVCEAQSQSPLLVEWYKDGRVIDATWRRYRQTNNDLRIRNARKSDAGLYR